jgi:asparagine synthetase B (glutamine-hydrolysing)
MMVQVYVNGMYAFVLYDSAQDLYMAARDPVGKMLRVFSWP